jgi:hypothetical protein
MKMRYAVKAGLMSAPDLAVVGFVIRLWLTPSGRDLPAIGEAGEEEDVVGEHDPGVLLVDVDGPAVGGGRQVELRESLHTRCLLPLLEVLPGLLGQQRARPLG